MKFKKGQSGNPKGKPKGSKDKIPQALKAMILEALDNAGGVDYLTMVAKKNPQAFLALIGKILPMQLTGNENKEIEWKWIINDVSPKKEIESLP